MRTYTVRRVDAERREIAIDFVVHGDMVWPGRGPAPPPPDNRRI